MKIVSYNVNGLRARLASARCLRSFLDSLDADIICLQETKLCRQDMSADLAIATGYESFFSCTRTVKKGRIGYSGVATFCRVGDALPLSADEGFTGLLHCSKLEDLTPDKGRVGCYEEVWNMTNLSIQDLLLLDGEGRCVVTDHGSFVLFNIYGPRVEAGDSDRLQFKFDFFRALQCRWEALLRIGRAVIVVGDFNISPFCIDSCDPGPHFEKNPSRIWLRALLQCGGGPFVDVFRQLHPRRKEAYTCWSQASGAEEFNYGVRIDLILAAGPCSHSDRSHGKGLHCFEACEVEACDILLQHKRTKTDSLPRWAGGRSLKLDGSDHAPVYVKLRTQPYLVPHAVPPLAARFMPELRGRQQSIVPLLQKHSNVKGVVDSAKPKPLYKLHNSEPDGQNVSGLEDELAERLLEDELADRSLEGPAGTTLLGEQEPPGFRNSKFMIEVGSSSVQQDTSRLDSSAVLDSCGYEVSGGGKILKTTVKQGHRKNDGPRIVQSSLESFFSVSRHGTDWKEVKVMGDGVSGISHEESMVGAAAEWKRIQRFMAANVPMCKGHGEPCVVRQVKKAGPNVGRGFYVCARGQGPVTNPEARCDHFEWAFMKAKSRKRGLVQD